jgi:S-phase kinase-associated protein 1
MAGHKIKLQSSDGDTFDVEVDIAKQSATIKTMLEGRGICLLDLIYTKFF